MATTRTGQAGLAFAVAGRGRRGLLQSTALQAAVLLVVAFPAAAQPAPNARPTGGTVVGGAASIANAPHATTITQSSQRAAIDWRSFDVGAKQSVTFAQPSTSAVTLNRVVGPDPSAIAGRITANGRIVITNQSGVIFTPGAQVDAQSVIISAASQSAADFMAGKTAFNQPARPGARVVNQGTITVGQAGLVGLVAPQVANSGVINARLGHVVMAGAETHILDLYGDGLLSIDVTNQVRTAPQGARALVTNTGIIVADGGTVKLTAAAADGLVQTLVSAGGRVSAKSAEGRAGQISIAGTGGSVEIEGVLDVRGTTPGATGGAIAATASDTVNVAAGARLRASGPAGGGSVTLGAATATRRTLVQPGAEIAADAIRSGPGGSVKVLSTSATVQAGRITARGGRLAGNGGTVEVSSQTGLRLGGPIDVSAKSGTPGTILVDPRDLTIAAGGTTPLAATDPNLGYALGGTLSDAIVDPASLVALNGNVHLQASRSLTIASAVSLTAPGAGLTLESGSDLLINSAVALSADGPVVLSAGAVFSAGNPTSGYNPGATLTIGGPVTSRGAYVALNSGAGGIVLAANVVGQAVQLSTGGPVTQPAGIVVTTGTANVLSDGLSGTAASVALTQPNAITAIPSLNATTGGITVNEAAGGTLALGAVSVSTAGQNIRIVADNLAALPSQLSRQIFAQGGTVTLAPVSSGRPVEVFASGTADPSRLSIPAALLQVSLADTLSLGGASAGGIALGRSGEFVDLRQGISGESTAGFLSLQLTTAAAVTQGGSIAVGTLAAQAASINLPLTGNFVGTLGAATTTGPLTVASGQDLTVAGPVAAGGAAAITAYDGGGGGTLTLAGNVTAPALVLQSSYATRQVAGIVTTNVLSGAVTGAPPNPGGLEAQFAPPVFDVTLPDANRVAAIGTYALLGNFTYNGAVPLRVSGPVAEAVPSVGTVALTNAGAISLTGTVSAGAVSLVATGAIGEGGAGAIVTAQLAASGTAITLAGGANQIQSATTLAASAGSITLTDSVPLTVAGTLSVLSGQSILLTADTMSFAAGSVLSAPSGLVALAPATAGRGIEVVASGTASAGVLSLGSGAVGSVQAGTLQVGSASSGAIVIGRAGDTIDLTGHAPTLSLLSPNAVSEGGVFNVATLTGSAASATLGGANRIQTLGSFQTRSGFTLSDATPLGIVGPVTDGTGIAIASAQNITLTGLLQAPNAALAVTGDITFGGGIVNLSGGLSLIATGLVTQTGGSVGAALLTGSAGSVSLTGGSNQIAIIGTFSGGKAFALTDGKALSVAGPLDAGSIALTAGTSITIDGRATAGSIALVAGGAIAEMANGDLVQSGGGGLTGSAASAALGQPNHVATLAGFTTSTGFALRDAVPLAVTGTVGDPVSIAVRSAGSMSVGGTVASAGAVALTVDALAGSPGGLGQTAGLIQGGTVTLVTAGGIAQSGTLVATTLTGSSGGPAALAGASNAVATLGGFASAGGFALADSRALTVAGPLTDTARIGLAVAGGLTLAGTLGAPGGAAVPGVSLVASGAIVQTGGTIAAGTLSGSGASVALTGRNSIAALGAFASGGGFTLVDTVPLTVSGAVAAGSGATLTLSDDAPSLGAGGSLAALGGTIVLQPATLGNAITLGGAGLGSNPAVFATTLVVGAADAGPLTITAAFNLANVGTLDLLSGGAIAETGAGALQVATLAGQGASAALGGANQIGTLGAFSTIGGFALATASGGLTVAGPLADPLGVALTVGGDLALTGSITTGVLTLTVTGAVTQPAGSLAAATLTGSVGNGVALNAAGNTVATLGPFSSDTGSVIVSVADRVEGGGTISPAPVGASGFSLTDARALTVTGPVTDPVSVTLATTGAGSVLTLAGDVQSASVGLFSSDALIQTAGRIVATTLTGQATDASLGNTSNSVAQLGDFAGTGTFLLADSVPLTVVGTVSAGALTIRDDSPTIAAGGVLSVPGGTVTLAARFQGGEVSLSGNAAGIVAETLVLGATDGGALTIASPLVLSNVATLDLRSGATVSETGAGGITVATLTGSASTVALDGANQIARLDGFTSAGDFSLATAGTLAVYGAVTVGNGAALTLAADAIAFAADGVLSAPGGSIALVPVGAALTLSGGSGAAGLAVVNGGSVQVGAPGAQSVTVASGINFGAGTMLTLQATTVSEGAAGAIGAGTLSAQGTDVTLGGANRLATLGSISASGTLAFNDLTSLTVSRLASGVAGVSLTAGADLALAPFSVVSSHGTVSLAASGSIDGGGASIVASSLAGSARSAVLTGLNSFEELKGFTTASDLTVSDFSSLTTRGLVRAGGSLTLSTSGSLTIGGSVSAEVLSLTAQTGIGIVGGSVNAGTVVASSGAGISLANQLTSGPVMIKTLGSFSAVGDIDVGDALPGLVLSGPVTSANGAINFSAGGLIIQNRISGGTVSLRNFSDVTESAPAGGGPAGSIQANSLSLQVVSAGLNGPNRVGQVGPSNVTGSLVLNDLIPVTLTGVIGRNVSLQTPGDVSLGAANKLSSSLTVTAGGALASAPGLADLSVGVLNAAASSVNVVGTIATLGSIGASGNLQLQDLGPLTVAGSATAATIDISAAGALFIQGAVKTGTSSVSSDGRATLIGGSLASDALVLSASPFAGLAPQFVQAGTLSVAGAPLTVQLGEGGFARFNDLEAPAVAVTLALANGTATGRLNVGSLLVRGSGGGSALTGRVGGIGGMEAAQASRILPAFDPLYLLNGCAIAAVTCTITPPPQPPSANAQIVPTTIFNPYSFLRPDLLSLDLLSVDIGRDRTADDVPLPNISDRDY